VGKPIRTVAGSWLPATTLLLVDEPTGELAGPPHAAKPSPPPIATVAPSKNDRLEVALEPARTCIVHLCVLRHRPTGGTVPPLIRIDASTWAGSPG
jgi:hypothetical protein